MSRNFFALEKGIRVYKENSSVDYVEYIFGAGAPVGTSGETDFAPLGSLYNDTTNGDLYIKRQQDGLATDWTLVNQGQAMVGNWRPERVNALTNQVLVAGAVDPTTFSDNDDGRDHTAFTVGHYVIGGANGTPILFEITEITAPNITLAVADPAIATDDMFAVKYYMPDPAGQENQAIVSKSDGVMVKVADVDWNFANAINIAAGYTPGNGSITTADSVQSAIQKLDGNQQDIQIASGLDQGAIDFGAFAGNSLADAQTAKQLFQRVEVLLEQMKGVEVNGVTAITTIDAVPVATVRACKWHVIAFNEATPVSARGFEVSALNDGSTTADDTVYAKTRTGGNITLDISVDVVGGEMRLRVSAPVALTVIARRLEVINTQL